MRITTYGDIPWVPFPDLRGGPKNAGVENRNTLYRTLFKGKPGSVGNYEAAVYSYKSPKAYPRHRHDFDQIRYTLAGVSPWAPGQVTPVGSLAYFPAGTYYGPYERQPGLEIFFIQFQGAGCPIFVDYDSLAVAHGELAKRGVFEGGAYSWIDEGGKRHNMDGHQAAVEYLRGHDEEFPAARFSSPIEMKPDNFAWTEIEPGVHIKELGTFTECEARLAILRVTDASFGVSALDQTTLLFVTRGAGKADGRAVGPRDGMLLEPPDEGVISSAAEMEMFMLGLPRLTKTSISARNTEPLLTHV